MRKIPFVLSGASLALLAISPAFAQIGDVDVGIDPGGVQADVEGEVQGDVEGGVQGDVDVNRDTGVRDNVGGVRERADFDIDRGPRGVDVDVDRGRGGVDVGVNRGRRGVDVDVNRGRGGVDVGVNRGRAGVDVDVDRGGFDRRDGVRGDFDADFDADFDRNRRDRFRGDVDVDIDRRGRDFGRRDGYGPDDNWRYKYINNHWWYWMPGGYWSIYGGDRWHRYDPGTYSVWYSRWYPSYAGRRYYDGGYYDGGYYDDGYYYGDGGRYRSGYRGYGNRGARMGADIGADVGGAIGGPEGAAVGAGIGAAVGDDGGRRGLFRRRGR